MPGSESAAGNRTVNVGTWESQSVLKEAVDKPNKGKDTVSRIGSRTDLY